MRRCCLVRSATTCYAIANAATDIATVLLLLLKPGAGSPVDRDAGYKRVAVERNVTFANARTAINFLGGSGWCDILWFPCAVGLVLERPFK